MKKIVFIHCLMPLILIPYIPVIYYIFSSWSTPLEIFVLLLVTIPVIAIFITNCLCLKNDLKKWFNFGIYDLIMTVTVFFSMFFVYLSMRPESHNGSIWMSFPSYLLTSLGFCVINTILALAIVLVISGIYTLINLIKKKTSEREIKNYE